MREVWDILTYPYARMNVRQPHVRWFARAKDGTTLGGIVHSAADLEASVTYLNRNGWDIFAHLNPTGPRLTRRAAIGDTLAWAFTLVDLDPLDGGCPETAAIEAAHKVMNATQDGPDVGRVIHAPAIIYTGRGVHLWLRFEPRVEEWWRVGDGQRRWLRSLWVPDGFRIDALGDTARVVRLPGTINHKTGRMAKLLSPGQIAPDWVPAMVLACAQEVARPQGPPAEQGLEWQDVKDSLTERARIFLVLGASAGVRHETCWHVARLLFERGVTRESALLALHEGNNASAEKLSARELSSIIKQVYGG